MNVILDNGMSELERMRVVVKMLGRTNVWLLIEGLQDAIAYKNDLIECHRVQWAKRGHKKIIPKEHRTYTNLLRRRNDRMRRLARALHESMQPITNTAKHANRTE